MAVRIDGKALAAKVKFSDPTAVTPEPAPASAYVAARRSMPPMTL